MEKRIITVDLGGTKVLTALLNEKAEIIARDKVPTNISKGPEHIVELVAGTINNVLKEASLEQKDIQAIAMGVPGTVNPHTGMIGNAPNLKIKSFNIKDALQKYFEIPVFIENDVNLAALGIKSYEFENKLNNCLVVFVGTGIGGALIFDGKLYRGSSFFAGEIGHMKIDATGNLATDPKKSKTFEAIASRTGMVNSIKKDIKSGKESMISDLAGKRIKSKVLANAIEKKDKVVTERIDEGCKIIGTVLGSIVTLLNIDSIILGGGVVEAMGDYMKNKIEKSFKKAVLKEPGAECKLYVTKLGDDAPLYGGIALAEEFSGS